MIKRIRFPRIFPGWWLVLTGGVLTFIGNGFYLYGISALFKPIASELGFNRATTSVAASIGRLEGGIESPLAGWITDKFGPRGIITLGVFIAGLGFILMNFIQSLWAFYLVWGVIAGTGTNIALSVSLQKAITNWFVKKRGLAISIRAMCGWLSGILLLPLVAWLIATQGWRLTCLFIGLAMWLIGLPLAWFVIKRERPEYYGLLPDGAPVEEATTDAHQMIARGVQYAAEVQEVEFTLRQAMRTPAYWLLIAAQAGQGMVGPVVTLHGIPFLTDMGVDPLKAAVIMGMMISATVPFMLIGGLLVDRLQNHRLRFLMGGTFFLQAIGITVFLLNQTMAMVYVFFLLYYVATGLNLPANIAIRGRYFGRKAYGSIHGSSMGFLAIVGVIAPIYAGWIYDTTGSYLTAFQLSAVLLALSLVLILLASPPKPPAQVTDIRQIL